MNATSASAPVCGSQHCITCGDDGVPMTVVRIDPRRGLALCAAPDGGRASVETALVEPVAPGDRLLVHAGTAIAVESAGADSIGSSAGSKLPPGVAGEGSASSELPAGSARVEVPGLVRDTVVES